MKTFEVRGSTTIGFVYEVQAEDEESAIDKACEQCYKDYPDTTCVDTDEVNEL